MVKQCNCLSGRPNRFEELRALLHLKDSALKMLQDEVAELQEALPQQLQMEARFRQLAQLLEPQEESMYKSTLLDRIGSAVKEAKTGKLHAIHAGFHGYPEFDNATELPYPVDKFGAKKRGIGLPTPEPQQQQKSCWLYQWLL